MSHPKIVLLTDFSPLSKVAMKFALKLGGPLEADFTVLSVIRVEGAPRASLKMKTVEKTLSRIAEEEGAQLIDELKKELKGNFKIQFKGIRSHTVAEMVRRYTDKNPTNMVVMGSRGASALKKARLGGTTVSVIDEVNVPVLAIPDFAQYKNLQKIVYATDLKNVEKELSIITEFAAIFHSHVHMIHVVSAMDKKVETDVHSVEAIIKKSGYDKLDFRVIIDDDIPGAIDKYIKETKADLLTTFTHRLSLVEKLFGKSVTRTLAYMGAVPLLAIKRK